MTHCRPMVACIHGGLCYRNPYRLQTLTEIRTVERLETSTPQERPQLAMEAKAKANQHSSQENSICLSKHGEKKWKCDKCCKRYVLQSDWKAHEDLWHTSSRKPNNSLMSAGAYTSETALLQKAAEIGAKESDNTITQILLRGFSGYSTTNTSLYSMDKSNTTNASGLYDSSLIMPSSKGNNLLERQVFSERMTVDFLGVEPSSVCRKRDYDRNMIGIPYSNDHFHQQSHWPGDEEAHATPERYLGLRTVYGIIFVCIDLSSKNSLIVLLLIVHVGRGRSRSYSPYLESPSPRYSSERDMSWSRQVVVDPEATLLIQGVVLLITHLRETGVGAGHTLRIIVACVVIHTAMETLVLDPL
nr:protein indeterminate-domain 12-like [Tanacetum cinerariifolium]